MIMAKEYYAAYETTTGAIWQTERVDRNEKRTGTSVVEYLERYLIRYPDRSIVYTGNMDKISPETHKVSGGNVVVKGTDELLDDYKNKKKVEQLEIGKAVFQDKMMDSDNIETYHASMKSYFINTVKAGIDASALDDKDKVDDFVKTIKWDSV